MKFLKVLVWVILYLLSVPITVYLFNLIHDGFRKAYNRTRNQLGMRRKEKREREYPPIDQDIPDEDFFEVPLPPDDKN